MNNYDAVPDLNPADLDAIVEGRHADPFSVLGPHRTVAGTLVRVLLPGASAVDVIARTPQQAGTKASPTAGNNAGHGASNNAGTPVLASLTKVHPAGLFVGTLADAEPYRLRIDWSGTIQEADDAYAFGTQLSDESLGRLSAGDPAGVDACLGSRVLSVDGVSGVLFAVWAPNARRASVVGDFNSWDGRRHPMRLRHASGVWEIFIPGLGPGTRYKYELIAPGGYALPLRADPVARQTERPPATASIVAHPEPFGWSDNAWMATRAERQTANAPISIYEVHAESWMRVLEEGARGLVWPELAERLIPYAKSMGFTHLEFLPLAEYPFGGSWGYQPLGQFAPSARFGTPEQFAAFVDRCHEAELGVIVDWVPAHFPNDAHGLTQFDGTPLYEHADPREGYHQDWNTMIYNLGRNEVSAFLLAAALSWLERFHIDALRVDAVASMLYRDYSRKSDQWIPNKYGGRENLESIDFLRRLNTEVPRRAPGAITIAEESTAWPGVTAPVADGGLGFNFKWNMGWMHDTLHYMQLEPIYRQYHHHEMTFGMIYAYSERFVLPLSHDEVVHGKGSLIGRMPGDRWQRFANLRAYFGFMWTHPGKKLLFMGGEIGQFAEWNHDQSPHWHLLDDPMHAGVQRLLRDLNGLYVNEPALFASDADPAGFNWLVGDDSGNSVFAFRRASAGRELVSISNMTPLPRENYRIGLPSGGRWVEALNTDAGLYGGANIGNAGAVYAEASPMHGQPFSVALTLPPLATLVLRPG